MIPYKKIKKLKSSFFISILIIISCTLQAQQVKIDSMLYILKSSKEDTSKVNVLNTICRQYINNGNYKQALQYSEQAKSQAEKLNFKKGMAISFYNFGIIYHNQGNYSKAIDSYTESLKIREASGDKKGMANSFNNIGLIYLKFRCKLIIHYNAVPICLK